MGLLCIYSYLIVLLWGVFGAYMLICTIATDASCAKHELANGYRLLFMLSTFADNARALITLPRCLELLLKSHIREAGRDTLGSGEVVAIVPFCHWEEFEVLGEGHAVLGLSGRALVAAVAAPGGPSDPRVTAGGAWALPCFRGRGIQRCRVDFILIDSVAIYKGHGNRLHGFGSLKWVCVQGRMSVARSAKFYF